MSDLEQALRELDVEWPATPDLATAVRARIAAEPAPREPWRARLRRRLAPPAGWRARLAYVAAALAVLAGGTLAVSPDARSTVLRWLGIKSVEIKRAPPPRPTVGASLQLGRPATIDELREAGVRVLVPRALGAPGGVYETTLPDGTRAASLVYAGGHLLVQSFEARATPFIQKTVAGSADVERLTVDGATAYWITGAHGFAYSTGHGVGFEEARIAGPALLVDRADGLLLRIEGRIGRDRAVEIARSVE